MIKYLSSYVDAKSKVASEKSEIFILQSIKRSLSSKKTKKSQTIINILWLWVSFIFFTFILLVFQHIQFVDSSHRIPTRVSCVVLTNLKVEVFHFKVKSTIVKMFFLPPPSSTHSTQLIHFIFIEDFSSRSENECL